MSEKYPYCNTCVLEFYRNTASQPSEGVKEGLVINEAPQTPPNKTMPLERQETAGNNMSNKKAVIQSVERYVPGTNEYLDRILGDDVPWVIQGNKGRRPIIADTEADARARYLKIDSPLEESEDAEEEAAS